MKKMCTGPMQFAPYRPWSEERKAAARAREIARRALTAAPLNKRDLPQMLVATTPDWHTPDVVEYGCIKPNPSCKRAYVLLVSESIFTLRRRQTLHEIYFEGKRYKFEQYMSFPAATYCIEAAGNRIEIGEADGAFGDIVRAYAS